MSHKKNSMKKTYLAKKTKNMLQFLLAVIGHRVVRKPKTKLFLSKFILFLVVIGHRSINRIHLTVRRSIFDILDRSIFPFHSIWGSTFPFQGQFICLFGHGKIASWTKNQWSFDTPLLWLYNKLITLSDVIWSDEIWALGPEAPIFHKNVCSYNVRPCQIFMTAHFKVR